MLFAAELADKSPAKVGTPSITIRGNELKLMELIPLILNTGGLFNTRLEYSHSHPQHVPVMPGQNFVPT
jgi:hypothetical protein